MNKKELEKSKKNKRTIRTCEKERKKERKWYIYIYIERERERERKNKWMRQKGTNKVNRKCIFRKHMVKKDAIEVRWNCLMKRESERERERERERVELSRPKLQIHKDTNERTRPKQTINPAWSKRSDIEKYEIFIVRRGRRRRGPAGPTDECHLSTVLIYSPVYVRQSTEPESLFEKQSRFAVTACGFQWGFKYPAFRQEDIGVPEK